MKKFNMKKTTAAAVAATVGAVLLLGGAGTLAFWSDNETSTTQAISSGSLDLGPATGGTWSVKKTETSTAVPFTGAAAVVPGDILSTTISIPATMIGTNLKARLTITPTVPVTNLGTTTSPAPIMLAVAGSTAAPAVLTSTPIVRDVTPGDLGTVAVTISVAIPYGTVIDNTNMTKTLSAISIAYKLEQIANTP